MVTETASGSFAYTFDYAGCLRNATSVTGVPGYTQNFQYNRAGSMTNNGRVGAYAYGTSKPRHAPVTVTKGGVVTPFAYDANDNMTAGLDGRAMTYDGENRPLSVTRNGKMTCYVYGAGGSRLKKTENMAPAANCNAAPTGSTPVTVYLANVEIRNYGLGAAAEQVITYPAPAVRLATTSAGTTASILHRDQLGSVRGVTGANGLRSERSTYRPFAEQDEVVTGTPVAETKGFIGERYDADAGLQYLNARYYDPKLGMFLQPDWFEVTGAGVGTNRYAYAGNDPVNASDPGGNVFDTIWDIGSLAYDLGKLAYAAYTDDGDLWDEAMVDLAVDAASAMVPGVPAGSSKVARMTGETAKSASGRLLGHQTHHSIPKNLEKTYGDLFKKTGIDLRGPRNTVDLPADRAHNPRGTIHRGKHNAEYERPIRAALDDIAERLDRGDITPSEAKREIESLMDRMRSDLNSGRIDLNKASKDSPPVDREGITDEEDGLD